jgi:stearoyl-CoA desaturase (delta-9 desaturase)
VFAVVPFIAFIVTLALGSWVGISALNALMTAVMYLVTAHGISAGYHRLFTHNAYKATRPLRFVLACLGTMAIEGDVISWAADHRRHHQFADAPGDPHSPWRFGTGPWALTKGLVWSHVWWMFLNEKTNARHYVPDLLADPDLRLIARWQPALVAFSFAGPAAVGGIVTDSWSGALSAFFWAGVVRVGLLEHVTWSVNSICHAFGQRPFHSRDRSGNVWWLALPSTGEAWHNYHHADPSSARHGVRRFQIDTAARLIWFFERFGWADSVRWPSSRRIASKHVDGSVPDNPPTGPSQREG